MKKMFASVQHFLKAEDGPTAVEYAVMLALIVAVCLTALTTLGTSAKSKYTTAGGALAGSGS